MASTTEELTGQSDQLVSALSFFHTGDEAGAPGRKGSGSKSARPAPVQQARTMKPNGHVPAAAAKTSGKAGVSLRLNDKHDDLDGEFERY